MTSATAPPVTGPAPGHSPPDNGTGARALPPTNDETTPEPVLRPFVNPAGPEALPACPPSIDVVDWDIMFEAVRSRLMHCVGERLGQLPDVPQHSAELSASLVQAVVLDCVSALDQLHAALKQERSRRPTS